MKICHFITGLGDGGAEAALLRLITHSPDHRHLVVSLTNGGRHESSLREVGTAVVQLDLKSPLGVVNTLSALRRIRAFDPDLVQSWMYHANLVGAGIARWVLRVPNAWGIHNSGIDGAAAALSTKAAFALSKRVSRTLPDLKISCSSRARERLIATGFDPLDWEVIPNGYDLSEFIFRPTSRAAIRRELSVADGDFLIGTVARWHQDKGHAVLFAALRRLFQGDSQRVNVLLAGPGMSRDNVALGKALREHDLCDKILLLGPVTDVAGTMSALDLLVMPSAREAFPNVVCEALACETPVVCTDAGDAAEIIGPLGRAVRPGDVDGLAASIREMVTFRDDREGWHNLRAAGRRRMEQLFTIDRMVARYEAAWERLLSG